MTLNKKQREYSITLAFLRFLGRDNSIVNKQQDKRLWCNSLKGPSHLVFSAIQSELLSLHKVVIDGSCGCHSIPLPHVCRRSRGRVEVPPAACRADKAARVQNR